MTESTFGQQLLIFPFWNNRDTDYFYLKDLFVPSDCSAESRSPGLGSIRSNRGLKNNLNKNNNKKNPIQMHLSFCV